MSRAALVAGLMAGILLVAGCESTSPGATVAVSESRNGPNGHRSGRPVAPTAAPTEAPRTFTVSLPAGTAPPGTSVVELAFPTGERATSTILLRQVSPSEIRVGSEYETTIEVVNLNSADLQNVVVNLENSKNVQILRSKPDAARAPDGAVAWLLGDLPGGTTKTITLQTKAEGPGVASNCLSVVYANVLCASTTVVQPSLSLVKTATPEACGLCEEVRLTYTVRNTGTGIAEGVVVRDSLPAGLMTLDGKSAVEWDVGNLLSGIERTFEVAAKASKAGTYASAASASSGGGLVASSASASTVVKEPKLTVTCEASDRVFLGRDVTYRFTVRNSGGCAASAAAVRVPLPSGSRFVSADHGGAVEGGGVVWRMPSVAAGQSTVVSMTVRPSGTGDAGVTATVAAECVDPVYATCSTEVAGIPAILLEVVDTGDPVEVGQETVLVVTATNQGSSTDHDVKVVATLPASMTFVSGTGASKVSASGQVVTLSPVAALAPGAKAEWRVTVRAASADDARSRWELTSAQFKAPVMETESTYLFR